MAYVAFVWRYRGHQNEQAQRGSAAWRRDNGSLKHRRYQMAAAVKISGESISAKEQLAEESSERCKA